MADPFDKIQDSSVWYEPDSMAVVNKKDSSIRIGVVKKVATEEASHITRYLVEINDKSTKILSWCRQITRFGGVYNYEDYILSGYTYTSLPDTTQFYSAKAGDMVVVAFLNGETREGVILGGLRHPGRTLGKLDPKDGPAYKKEFNGVEESINKDGEWTLTFKGQPTNIALLKSPAVAPITPPIYNPLITGSFMKFDKEGSWELNDKSIALPQSIKVDKSGGTITITSGKNVMTFDKKGLSLDIATTKFTIDSKLSMDIKTLDFSVAATKSIKLKALKVAIGSSGVELIDQLIQAIDGIGTVTVQSPIGPCSPISATPQWAQVLAIKLKLTSIKGSL